MRDKPVLPLLLRMAMILGAVFGVFGTTLGVYGVYLLLVGDGPVRFGDARVPKADFLAAALPFLGLYISACLTVGAASWALWKRHPRFRFLLTVLLVEFLVGDAAMLALAGRLAQIGPSELVTSILGFLVLASLGLWYLFRKDSVVSYYQAALRARVPNAD